MGKMKRHFLKSCNAILMAILALFGFTNCDRMGRDMYGTPHADFVIKGTVVDKSERQGIEDIQVKIIGTRIDADGVERIVYKKKRNTDAEGRFKLQIQHHYGFLTSDEISHSVHFSDIENELFQEKAVKLDFENFVETRPPSGSWFQGEFTKILNVQLIPIDENEENENDKYE